MNPPSCLYGKTAIVTGASRGIGRAIALLFAGHGATVGVLSRSAAACDRVVAEIENDGGLALALPCDVADLKRLKAAVTTFHDRFGRLEIVVGNAAANPHFGPTTDVNESQFDKIFNTNVKANLWLAKYTLPLIKDAGGGALIFITSIAGLWGNDDIGVYGMSKAAEASMARSLAVGWGRHNIRVNCLAPGLTRTDFARPLWQNPNLLERQISTFPLKRMAEPKDIARVALFLASDGATFVTGQTIVADGGVTISSTRATARGDERVEPKAVS